MDTKEKKELLNEEWKLDKDDNQIDYFEDVEMDDGSEKNSTKE